MHHTSTFAQWAVRTETRQNAALGLACTHCGSFSHSFRGEQNVITYRLPIYQCHSCGSSFGGPRYPLVTPSANAGE
jgi:ribosomal protein L37AE/L43A